MDCDDMAEANERDYRHKLAVDSRDARIAELEAQLSRFQHVVGGGVIEDVDGSVRSMFEGLSKYRMRELESLVESLQAQLAERVKRRCGTCIDFYHPKCMPENICNRSRGPRVLFATPEFGCTKWKAKP